MAFSSDGHEVIAADSDRFVRLCETDTGREICRFKLDSEGIADAVELSVDKHYLFAVAFGVAEAWNVRSGEAARFFEPDTRLTAGTLSPDGRSALVCREDGTVWLWPFLSRGSPKVLASVGGEVSHISMSTQHHHLLVTIVDKILKPLRTVVWDFETGKPLLRVENSRGAAFCHSSEDVLVLTNAAVNLWHFTGGGFVLQTSRPLPIRMLRDSVRMVANDAGLVALFDGSELCVWDYQRNTVISDLKNVPAIYAAISPKGDRVIISGLEFPEPGHHEKDAVKLISTSEESQRNAFEADADFIFDFDISSDQRHLAAVGRTTQVCRLYDLVDGYVTALSCGQKYGGVKFSPDGRLLATGGESLSEDALLGLERENWEADMRREEADATIFRAEEGEAVPSSELLQATNKLKEARAALKRIQDSISDYAAQNRPYDALIWDSETGALVQRLHPDEKPHGSGSPRVWPTPLAAVAWSRGGSNLFACYTLGGELRMWDVASGREDGWYNPVRGFLDLRQLLCQTESRPQRVLAVFRDGLVSALFDGGSTPAFPDVFWQGTEVDGALSPSGRFLAAAEVLEGGSAKPTRENISIYACDDHMAMPVRTIKCQPEFSADICFSPDRQWLALGVKPGTVGIWNVKTGQRRWILRKGDYIPRVLVFSPDQRYLYAAGDGGHGDWFNIGTGPMHIWNFRTGRLAGILPEEVMFRPRIIFSHEGRFVWFNQADGSIAVARAGATNLLCRIRWSTAGNWTVIAPDGQFDADNVDEITGLHWVFPDDPLHALPPEIFMREYFHHGLLADLLQNPLDHSRGLPLGEATNSAPVRPLQSLNRALPTVTSVTVSSLKSPDLVRVEITLAPGLFVAEQTSKIRSSKAYDLQLFEDGQLVGECPEPNNRTPSGIAPADIARWRNETLVDRDRVVFPSLKLRHRHAGQALEFSAYAFNEDRIRGPIAKTRILGPTNSLKKTAYVISVGVNDYGAFAKHLQFAVLDAQAMARKLASAFQTANYALESELLVSDYATNGATKTRISSVLASVAARSTPDDVVAIFFAGHGFCARTGEFYLLPSVSGFSGQSDWENPSSETLSNCISSTELSIWLRSIVAEHLVLILDACQSAAAVGSGGFRPAPLGDRGLGQLAYDKGMFILAACETDQQAQEIGGQIGGGALTHVLLQEGLAGTLGSRQGHSSFTLRQWLRTPVHTLPRRFGLQQPVLFDCERKRASVEDLVLQAD